MTFPKENFNTNGCEFTFVGEIRPVLNEKKEIVIYYPDKNSRYENNKDYELMKLNNEIIGNKGFCYFSIKDENDTSTDRVDTSNINLPRKKDGKYTSNINLPKEEGVYAWVINNQVVYIGRATNAGSNSLYCRFKNGYGHISPRNCYKNIRTNKSGQITNLKMNRVVIDNYNSNRKIYLFIHLCQNSKDVEACLINSNWYLKEAKEREKATNEHYTLEYNARHEIPKKPNTKSKNNC